MRFAYADPPYLGCCKLYDHYHGDSGGCWDDLATHDALIGHLDRAYDGWALSLSSTSLQSILPLCPTDARVAAWVKPFAAFKRNVRNAYTWEPVIICGGRISSKDGAPVTRDHLSEPITLKRGLTGAKHPTVQPLGARHARIHRRHRRTRRPVPRYARHGRHAQLTAAGVLMTRERWHGTIGGYTNHSCRCQRCRDAAADYQYEYRDSGVKSYNLRPARLVVDKDAPRFEDAPCAEIDDPDVMFPYRRDSFGNAIAKAICELCDQVPECLAWALDNNISEGVWGGATELERTAILRRRRRDALKQRRETA
jgi:hypothetical protein